MMAKTFTEKALTQEFLQIVPMLSYALPKINRRNDLIPTILRTLKYRYVSIW